MKADCIFCKIIAKEIPAALIAENNEVLVIKDINPKATIHYLIIPKKHFPDLQSLEEQALDETDTLLMGKLMLMAKQLSKDFSIPGFKLIVNNGKEAGQCVFHFHIHFLSGKQLSGF